MQFILTDAVLAHYHNNLQHQYRVVCRAATVDTFVSTVLETYFNRCSATRQNLDYIWSVGSVGSVFAGSGLT